MAELTSIIKESFIQYSGAVLQNRALVDVRDFTKPSARQIFYCMYTDKFIHSKPFKKTLKAIGSSMRMYIHGDSSCEGIIMRSGQPFAMRYPLIEVEGSYGNLMESGNWAAPRYTSSRLSELTNYLFSDINKDTIEEWRDNYDDTEKYPTVSPSKGFYNLVNGATGIGTGMSMSSPQYNLCELNKALIKVLWNPEIDFEEIYCAPDFATGAILLNEEEVKESMRIGHGPSCKLRAVIEFDDKERCLIVKEIPYGVYTNTICGELEAILNDPLNPGIDRFNDLTGSEPCIKIYLTKSGNVNRVIKTLYKKTSLQSHFGINFTALKDGRYPQNFSWKEMLIEHINHEKIVYRRGFEFDLKKINERLHIINGLLRAIAQINEVVKTIKQSKSTQEASIALQKLLIIDEIQAKAILDIKLARLAHLEIEKLEKEKLDLEAQKAHIEAILNDENLLKEEIANGLRKVANTYGDARRTKIMNIESEDDEPKEIKTLQISLSNKNNVIVNELSSLYTQKRGGVGNKVKLGKDEFIYLTRTFQTNEQILFFTNFGNYYSVRADEISQDATVAVESLLHLKDGEIVCELISADPHNMKQSIHFFTKNGMLKKSALSEYNTKRSGAIKAITLDEDDEIVRVIIGKVDSVALLSKKGRLLLTDISDVREIGRVSRGVKAIKLDNGDEVVSARSIEKQHEFIVSVSENGFIKKTNIYDFSFTGRNTKGNRIYKISDETGIMADFFLTKNENLIICSNKAQIKIANSDIPELSKDAQGVKSIKLKDNEKIIKILAS